MPGNRPGVKQREEKPVLFLTFPMASGGEDGG